MRGLIVTVSSVLLLFNLAGCESETRTTEAAPAPAQAAVPVQTSAPTQTASPEPSPAALLSPREDLLAVGERAPYFQADDQNGNRMELSRVLRTRNVVLIFYPGDDTPGCTKQLCAVRDDWSGFQKRNAIVLGINPAGITSHAAFATKYNFPFPVLSDQDAHISTAYGARGENPEKSQRTVYVIRRDGRIAMAERGMVSHEKIFAALDY